MYVLYAMIHDDEQNPSCMPQMIGFVPDLKPANLEKLKKAADADCNASEREAPLEWEFGTDRGAIVQRATFSDYVTYSIEPIHAL